MEWIGELKRWIAENNALLSGLVSLIALAGVVLSPVGRGIRRLFERAEPDPARQPEVTDAAPAKRSADVIDPLLAVLAFDNLSNDAEMQFFSDGISEEIIQRLARCEAPGDRPHNRYLLSPPLRSGAGGGLRAVPPYAASRTPGPLQARPRSEPARGSRTRIAVTPLATSPKAWNVLSRANEDSELPSSDSFCF